MRRIPLGLLARYVELARRVLKRGKRDRCLGCGARPEPLDVLCARCAERMQTLLEKGRK